MTRQTLQWCVLTLIVAALSAAAGYGWARKGAAPTAANQNDVRQPLYWYDPMVPNQHFDKPGKSPFMDMQLVPKYADEPAGSTSVRVDAGVQQNLGLRLSRVETLTLAPALEVPASVQFNQRAIAVVQARSGGFVERVYGRAPGDVVPAGAALADVLVPDWAAAQSEFLAVLRQDDANLRDAARARLRLSGMPTSLIAEVERSGRVRPVTTISAPIAGVLQSLDVRQGMTLSPGQTLATLNGLTTVWLEAAVPEAQAAGLAPGQAVNARLTAYPGESFQAKVAAVLPELNGDNRTVRLRVALPNPQGRFRPGMYAQLSVTSSNAKPALWVVSEAIIRSGKRNLVITVLPRGGFAPLVIEPGREQDGKTEVLRGLEAGQQVVASGQFLIDSEASLSGVLARLGAGNSKIAAPATQRGIGVVEALSADEITLSHEAIPAVGWEAMTMPFKLAQPALAQGFKPGDRVGFDFTTGEDGPVIHQLERAGGQP